MAFNKKILNLKWSDLTKRQKKNFENKAAFRKLKIEKGNKTPEFDFSKRWEGLDDSVKEAWKAKGKGKKDWRKSRVNAGFKIKDPETTEPTKTQTPLLPGKTVPGPSPFSETPPLLSRQPQASQQPGPLAPGKTVPGPSPFGGFNPDVPFLSGADDGQKGGQKGGEKGEEKGEEKGGRPGDGDNDYDYEPKFPEDVSGKDIKKYKTQGGKIRRAAEADLARRLGQSFDPEKIKKAKKIKSAFKKDRQDRKNRLDKIEKKVSRPKFKDYKDTVKDIRKGKGPAKEFGYAGKFQRMGKSLGIKYGKGAREDRSADRLANLRRGINKPKKVYQNAAESLKVQTKKGKQIIKRLQGEMQ